MFYFQNNCNKGQLSVYFSTAVTTGQSTQGTAIEHICNRDEKYNKWVLNWQKYSVTWPSFFLPFKSAYNSFSVFKQFNFFLSLFKVLHQKRIYQKQGLKNIFSAYFSPSSLFLFLCDRTIKNWKALVDIPYVTFFHDIILLKILKKYQTVWRSKY